MSGNRTEARGAAPASDATIVEKADVAVARKTVPSRKHPLTRLIGAISDVGDQKPMVLISSAVLAAGLIGRKARLARAGARMLAAHYLATAIKAKAKESIDRTRPDSMASKGYEFEPGDHDSHELSSFPSGHTAGSVAVARALGREYQALAAPALGAAAAIAVVQVVRASHFPSDVVAGAMVGLAAEAGVNAAAAMLEPTR